MTPLARDLQNDRIEKQAPGFIPGEVDIQPSHDRLTTRQASGFTPGVIDLSDLPLAVTPT